MGFTVGGDDENCVDALVRTGLEEEWHFVDHDGMGSAFGDLPDEALLFAGHSWMYDTFKLPKFAAMVEDNSPERVSIDGAVRTQNRFAETFHDLTPGRAPRPYQISSDTVRIDDDCATLLEHLGDRALSRRNASCEPDYHHASENSMEPSKKSLIAYLWIDFRQNAPV